MLRNSRLYTEAKDNRSTWQEKTKNAYTTIDIVTAIKISGNEASGNLPLSASIYNRTHVWVYSAWCYYFFVVASQP